MTTAAANPSQLEQLLRALEQISTNLKNEQVDTYVPPKPQPQVPMLNRLLSSVNSAGYSSAKQFDDFRPTSFGKMAAVDPKPFRPQAEARSQLPLLDPRKVFLGNLPPTITEEDLIGPLKQYGPVEEFCLLNRVSFSGCKSGFVRFARAEDAKNAIRGLHGSKPFLHHGNYPLTVKLANPPQAVIQRLADLSTANAHDSEALITSICTEFDIDTDALLTYVFPHSVNTEYATPTGKKAAHTKGEVKLFVGNLNPLMTQPTLTSLFAPFGNLIEVFLFKRTARTGVKCAFVRYSNHASAIAAINTLNGTTLQRKKMVVRIAEPPRRINGMLMDDEEWMGSMLDKM